MPEIFFTSDTHFGHANILKHARRPFASIEEHDEALAANWNAAVSPQDTVYFLGDFAMGGGGHAGVMRRRLQGNICFIVGNHDKPAMRIKDSFAWCKDVYMLQVDGQQIWLSHYAHLVWPKMHYGTWHLFGHSHGTLRVPSRNRCLDVGVDCHQYRPISFDQVRTFMNQKTFEPMDHHGRPADEETRTTL